MKFAGCWSASHAIPLGLMTTVPDARSRPLALPNDSVTSVSTSAPKIDPLFWLFRTGGVLKVVVSDPSDFDTLQKLQFILNRDLAPVEKSERADQRRAPNPRAAKNDATGRDPGAGLDHHLEGAGVERLW